MKVQLQADAPGISKLTIELPADEVGNEWDLIAAHYAHHARIPGYRPGKAPKQVVEKKFRKEIQDELTQKLVSRSYHQAVEQEHLRVVSLTNVEDVEFGQDRSLRFRATVITAPEFKLPDYKNIPVELPADEIVETEIDSAIERLRDQAGDS